ncbi:MAG: AAA family ATPase, partial [Bradymonadaceae bacterium]
GLLAEMQVAGPDADRPTPPPDDELTYARAYTAPEVREGLTPTLESDLYALGCVLFEAITGCRPIDLGGDEDAADGGDERLDLRPSALSELEPRCPAAWVDLILRLLAPDPDERPDFDEIRAVLSSSRGRSVDIPPSFVPEKQSFFGRDDVFDQLVANAQECVNDESVRVSMLSGSAGYGKTAMAERLAQWAAQRGWIVLRGHCYDRSSIIYQGWDAVAWQLAAICKYAMGEIDEKTDRLRRRAGRLFPVLTPEAPSETEDLERLEAVAALRQLLRVVSAERPTMILMDDLNWSSPDTADLLADVAGEPEGMQCHLVGTWRLDDAADNERLVDALETAPVDVDWVRVRGFRPHEAEEYVDAIAELAPSLRDRVLEVGGENPLLIEELIYQLHLDQMAHDERITRQTAGAAAGSQETPVGVPTPDTGVLEDPPETIEDRLVRIVERRIDALSRRELFIIQILSVATIPLPEQMLSLILDEEFHSGKSMSQSLRLLLDRLRSLRLVRQVETDRWERAYTASVDRRVEASGRYLVAVYEPTDSAGPVGVAVGYEESFTPVEYLAVPI